VVVFFLCSLATVREGMKERKRPAGEAGSTASGLRKRADVWLYCAAFIFGLALGVHHVTVGVTLPALAVLVYRTEGWQFFKSKRRFISPDSRSRRCLLSIVFASRGIAINHHASG